MLDFDGDRQRGIKPHVSSAGGFAVSPLDRGGGSTGLATPNILCQVKVQKKNHASQRFLGLFFCLGVVFVQIT